MHRETLEHCPLLPVRPKQADGEAVLSWLVRLAHANGCSLPILVNRLGFLNLGAAIGRFHSRDAKRNVAPSLLEALFIATGSARQTSSNAAWTGSALWLFELPLSPTAKRTIYRIPSNPRSPQTQYCPTCLIEYDFSHSLQWKLSFCTICPKHHRLLRSSCPHCLQGIDLWLMLSDWPRIPSLRFCANCGQDICYEMLTQPRFSAEQIGCLSRHQALNMALLNRRFQTNRAPFQVYSDTLEVFVRILSGWQNELPETFMPFVLWSAHHADLDRLFLHAEAKLSPGLQIRSTTDRAAIMLMVASILDPRSFDEAYAALKRLGLLLQSKKLLRKTTKIAQAKISAPNSGRLRCSAAVPRSCLQLQKARDVLPVNHRGHNRSTLSERLTKLTAAAQTVDKLLADRDPYENEDFDDGSRRSRRVLWERLVVRSD